MADHVGQLFEDGSKGPSFAGKAGRHLEAGTTTQIRVILALE